MRNLKNIKCPTCGRVGDWFSGKYGPFCSKRCKLIDLGKWLGEEHRISTVIDEHLEKAGKNLSGPEGTGD